MLEHILVRGKLFIVIQENPNTELSLLCVLTYTAKAITYLKKVTFKMYFLFKSYLFKIL